jgi:anti-anti-sigma factor
MEPLRVEDRGLERWILLEGELYHEEVVQLRAAFDWAVARAPGDVVVDLGGVTLIVSLGIGMIVSAREKLDDRGRTLRLANVPASVERTFRTLSLAQVFGRV